MGGRSLAETRPFVAVLLQLRRKRSESFERESGNGDSMTFSTALYVRVLQKNSKFFINVSIVLFRCFWRMRGNYGKTIPVQIISFVTTYELYQKSAEDWIEGGDSIHIISPQSKDRDKFWKNKIIFQRLQIFAICIIDFIIGGVGSLRLGNSNDLKWSNPTPTLVLTTGIFADQGLVAVWYSNKIAFDVKTSMSHPSFSMRFNTTKEDSAVWEEITEWGRFQFLPSPWINENCKRNINSFSSKKNQMNISKFTVSPKPHLSILFTKIPERNNRVESTVRYDRALVFSWSFCPKRWGTQNGVRNRGPKTKRFKQYMDSWIRDIGTYGLCSIHRFILRLAIRVMNTISRSDGRLPAFNPDPMSCFCRNE